MTRLPLMILAPIMGLIFRLRGPRAFFDEDLAVDDMPLSHAAEPPGPSGWSATPTRSRP